MRLITRLFTITALFLSVAFSSKAQEVDLLTGRLKMAIPLGSVQANDISVPISIYHHGGSVRVADGEGKCGVGWNLSVGGGVYREVRGLPDEINTSYRKGWLFRGSAVGSFSPQADDNLSTWQDETPDYTALEALHANYTLDTEPDIFSVNAPGLSFQYVLDQNGYPHLLNYVDVTIEFVPNVYAAASINVKTNNGITYTFGGTANQSQTRETALRRSKAGDPFKINTAANYIPAAVMITSVGYCYNWKLTKISSLASGTEAVFTYTPNASQLADGARKTYLSLDSGNYVIDLLKFYELESIKLKSYKVQFNWSRGLLWSVILADTVSQDQQRIELKYFSAITNNGTPKIVSKQFLSQVNRVGTGCERGESHSFQYEGITPTGNYAILSSLNWLKNWGQDNYGYFNNAYGNLNRPKLYLSPTESDGRRLRLSPISGVSYTTIGGDLRDVTSSSNFGALKKVVFPTGGYALITYESNNYLDTSVSPSVTTAGPGVRVQKITLQGGEPAFGKTIADTNPLRAVEKEYAYTLAGSTTTSGKILSPVKLGFIADYGVERVANNLGDEPVVYYSRTVEKILSKGYTVYEFNLPGVFPETSNGSWKASKSRIARGYNTPPYNVANGYYTFPYAPSTNYDFKRGQLSRVAVYNNGDTLLSEKLMTYTPISVNPLTIKGVRFEKLGSNYHYGIYEILTGQTEYLQQEVAKQASLKDPTKMLQTTTTYSYNSNQMLSSVTTQLPDNTSMTRTIKYARDFPFTTPTNNDAWGIKRLNEKGQGAAVVEEYTTRTTPGPVTTTVSAAINLYKDLGDKALLAETKVLLPESSFTPASMSGQSFTYSSGSYRLVSRIDEYEEGKPSSVSNDNQQISSTHFAVSTGLPIASFQNCTAQQSVFENFEGPCSFGMNASSPSMIVSNVSNGWTGQKYALFNSTSQSLSSSAQKTILKREDSVRVSCWVKGPTGRNITFAVKNGSTTVGQAALPMPQNDKWSYVEAKIKLNGNAGPFTLLVTTDATASLNVGVDDVLLLPYSARVSHQTALPFKGVTSSTDDRGMSTKITYDYLGRAVNTLDRNRNLVNHKEYSIANGVIPAPNARFDMLPRQPANSESVTFTPTITGVTNCDPNLVFAWEIDGVAQSAGSGGVLNYAFPTAGIHNVKFTATSSLYGTYSVTNTVCVIQTSSITVSTTVTNSAGKPAGLSIDCNSGVRNLNLILPSVPSGCFYNVSWIKNANMIGTGLTLSVSPISIPISGTAITETYVANIVLDCSGFTDCVPVSLDAFTSTATFVVTHNPADCQ